MAQFTGDEERRGRGFWRGRLDWREFGDVVVADVSVRRDGIGLTETCSTGQKLCSRYSHSRHCLSISTLPVEGSSRSKIKNLEHLRTILVMQIISITTSPSHYRYIQPRIRSNYSPSPSSLSASVSLLNVSQQQISSQLHPVQAL